MRTAWIQGEGTSPKFSLEITSFTPRITICLFATCFMLCSLSAPDTPQHVPTLPCQPVSPILQEGAVVLPGARASTRPDGAPASLLLSSSSKFSRSIRILFFKCWHHLPLCLSERLPKLSTLLRHKPKCVLLQSDFIPPLMAMSEDIFVVSTQGSWLLLALLWERQEVLSNNLQCSGQPHSKELSSLKLSKVPKLGDSAPGKVQPSGPW